MDRNSLWSAGFDLVEANLLQSGENSAGVRDFVPGLIPFKIVAEGKMTTAQVDGLARIYLTGVRSGVHPDILGPKSENLMWNAKTNQWLLVPSIEASAPALFQPLDKNFQVDGVGTTTYEYYLKRFFQGDKTAADQFVHAIETSMRQDIRLTCEGAMHCHSNAFDIVQSMARSGEFDLSKAQVLYLTMFQSYDYHVVVQVGELVYYADNLRSGFLRPVAARVFFHENNFLTESRVRLIPARVYLNEYYTRGRDYFGAQLGGRFGKPDSPNIAEARHRFRTLPVSEYLLNANP